MGYFHFVSTAYTTEINDKREWFKQEDANLGKSLLRGNNGLSSNSVSKVAHDCSFGSTKATISFAGSVFVVLGDDLSDLQENGFSRFIKNTLSLKNSTAKLYLVRCLIKTSL